jgi:23S rRNA (guanine2445-N2)-methyltransferase / 23S rRNA (guanine2069-N7)-methyltransferase
MPSVPFPPVHPVPRPLSAPVADEPARFTARTLEGLEWVLARELEGVGAVDLRIGRRTIEFSSVPGREKETLYRAVLESRTAIRVLEPLGRFRVESPEALYAAMEQIDWREQLKVSDTLRVDAAIHDTFLNHSLYAAQIVKDAIVDQLRTPSGRRPSVELRGATLRLALHLVGDTATIFRDAAGKSLHQRGWRTGEVEAPLSEVLAAGILAIAGWTPGEPVLDPMCGSGTFVVEAATIAAGMAPGLWRARRRGHGFFRFRDCDRDLADRLVTELEARVVMPAGSFQASDLDPGAVEATRLCAEAAGVAAALTIENKHFEQAVPAGDHGLVVTNPPYGERLALPRAGALFRRIGDWLVRACGGWRGAILAPDAPPAGFLGLRPTHRVFLPNGPIACRLLEVEIRERQHLPVETERLPAPASSITDPPNDPHDAAGSRAPAPPAGRPASGAVGPPRSGGRPVEDQLGDFRRRLAKRFKHLSKWARRIGTDAFRIYDRDIPEIPLVIDWYAGWLHAAEYERPHERTEIEHDVWLDRMIEAAAGELGVAHDRTFLKVRRRQREGGQYEKVDGRQALLQVREGGLSFEVNLSDYLDTGLFLDHRLTRAMVREETAGKRMLNLFSYTGSFSVHAAAGGATETVSVDLSNTYLDWTRTNLSLNGFKDAGRHRIVRDDARAFLEHRARRGEPLFDLVVADPPTFSRSARSELPWDVERDHAELLALVARNLSPGGIVYFSTNFRRFHLAEQSLAADFSFREITNRTIPEDFRNERIHRAWRMVRR